MNNDLHNEIQSALANVTDAELLSLANVPTPWTRAQDTLLYSQYLIKVPNTPNKPLIAINGNCVFTGQPWGTDAYPEDLLFTGLCLWAKGTPAQAALRFMSASEREFLISGISPHGWACMEDHEEPGDREPFFPPAL
jgi:hypothetical protein